MPRKTQEESQATRARIIEVALRLFSKRGFERASLSDVAKYAGVTRGAVYWHFRDKEELLTAVIEETELKHGYITILQDAAKPEEDDPLGKLKQSIMIMESDPLNEFINSKFVTMIIGIKNGFSGDKDLRKRLRQVDERRDEMVKKVILNCIAKGQLPINLDVDAAVEHLGIFVTGYFFQTRTSQTKKISERFDFVIEREFEQLKTLTQDLFKKRK